MARRLLRKAADDDLHAVMLLESLEVEGAAEALGRAGLYRVRAVAALMRWVRS